MLHEFIEQTRANAFLATRKVEELDRNFKETDEMCAKALVVLFDRIWECKNRIDENPEDKNLSIELAKLEGYVGTINQQHASIRAISDELKRFWIAISKGEDFPEWDD